MGEYISREAALIVLDWDCASQDALNAIKAIPAADVVPVRHGTWIKADEQPYFRKHYHAKVCSECGKRKDGKWLYCPYCGSKNQDGGQDDV